MHQIKSFLYFLKVIYQQRYVVRTLVYRDFQKKYLGSYLGLPWAFLQPAIFILSLWFVFSIGLRSGTLEDGTPFLPWLVVGIIPWFFISESINSAANSLLSNSFLIKQLYFRVGIIPLVPIASALIIHLFMILVLMLVVALYGYYPNIYWIQIPYFLAAGIVFLVGLGWLLSSLSVFVRDVQQFVGVALTLLFWLTPIFWNHESVVGRTRIIIDLNPMFYITNGYRNTFINNVWFFENMLPTIFFWLFNLSIFIVGAAVFHRLKPHFADVL